ncbi:MAG: hypothetical protein CM1200mP29_00620 [Verrucomicrobiota bacterium]|nr:MAG: hypothetical protein CM1200mP29_00620 [Verrucomicrobiota bacterium]
MTFVQATTGSGGWPLNVWLTPDLKPFFGGPYFPPEASSANRASLRASQIADAWKTQQTEILNSANDIASASAKASH